MLTDFLPGILKLIHFSFSGSGFDDDKELLMSQMNFEKKFGQSPIFVTSTLMIEGGVPPSSSPAALLKEAIHVISCGYEDKTEWGSEVCSAPLLTPRKWDNIHINPFLKNNVCHA